jgi:succinyl-CoA synthetase alpha subunit
VQLATGVAGILVLGRHLLAPDMLGYVASMTYNNAYLLLPSCGGALDPAARVRAVGYMPVHIADVGTVTMPLSVSEDGAVPASDNVRHIDFISLIVVKPLQKGHMYT